MAAQGSTETLDAVQSKARTAKSAVVHTVDAMRKVASGDVSSGKGLINARSPPLAVFLASSLQTLSLEVRPISPANDAGVGSGFTQSASFLSSPARLDDCDDCQLEAMDVVQRISNHPLWFSSSKTTAALASTFTSTSSWIPLCCKAQANC
eukprot:scaffold18699_cov125-Cylindrotheca_fusiformis.AAC.1